MKYIKFFSVLAFFALAFVFTIEAGAVFAQSSQEQACIGAGGTWTGDACEGEGDLASVFATVANILLFLIGAVAVVMLIVGGFRYVVSAGDSNAIESAKNTILYAIIGIVVAFLAWAAVDFLVDRLISGDSAPGAGDANGDES